jgi:hypothetical protein
MDGTISVSELGYRPRGLGATVFCPLDEEEHSRDARSTGSGQPADGIPADRGRYRTPGAAARAEDRRTLDRRPAHVVSSTWTCVL